VLFMSRVKLLFLSVLAVLVVGAVSAVSSASAAPTDLCPQTAGVLLPALCIETSTNDLVAETGLFPFRSVIEPVVESLLEVPVLGLHIECTVATNTGNFQQTVLKTTVLLTNVVITFTSCTILEALGTLCKVKEPIKTVSLDGTVANEDAESHDVVFTPETGTTFTTLELENNGTEICPEMAVGSHPVVGEQLCTILEAEKDKAVHLLECVEAGSKLKVSGQEALFKLTEEVALGGGAATSGLPWTIELA